MLYEVKTSNWGKDIEIFDHNDKSVLKAYYKKKYWYSSYYYLSFEINGAQLEIKYGDFWLTKYVIKNNDEAIGEITNINGDSKILFKGKKYLIRHNGLIKGRYLLLDQDNEMLISVRVQQKLLKSIFCLDRNTDAFNEDIPYLLLITYYIVRKKYGHH